MTKKAARVKTPDNILMALQEAQARSGPLTPEVMAGLAASLGVPSNDVYGVVSFYSFLSIRPLGRNVIRVCQSLPCHLKEGQAVIDAIRKALGVGPGRTTEDSRFTFELVNCIGLCDGAPAMLINHDVHTDLTPGKIAGILQKYK